MHVTVGGTLGAWVHDFLKSCLDMLTGFDLEAQSCHLKTVRIMLPFSGMEGGTPVAASGEMSWQRVWGEAFPCCLPT